MVRVFKNNKLILIPLEEYVRVYHSKVEDWWDETQRLINAGIELRGDHEKYFQHLYTSTYNSSNVKKKYLELLNSEIGTVLDSEVLKFIAHLYELGYFSRIGNPNIEDWLNTKNVFHERDRHKIPDGVGFSFMDLLEFPNGMNAFKNSLIESMKWFER